MSKTILITGSTDGIGLETARMLLSDGHEVLLHGRNPEKLEDVRNKLSHSSGGQRMEGFVADLSRLNEVEALAKAVTETHEQLDVLINNAGVYRGAEGLTPDSLDPRFAVNTVAPYLLAKRLFPVLGASGRVVNLSSAAQYPVDLNALAGRTRLSDDAAYAQSKLALTMWTRHVGLTRTGQGPVVVAVNPGSLLGTRMVKEAYGIDGGDVRIGAAILCRAALSDAFADAAGRYFDNDTGRFARPHPDGEDPARIEAVVRVIETLLAAGAARDGS